MKRSSLLSLLVAIGMMFAFPTLSATQGISPQKKRAKTLKTPLVKKTKTRESVPEPKKATEPTTPPETISQNADRPAPKTEEITSAPPTPPANPYMPDAPTAGKIIFITPVVPVPIATPPPTPWTMMNSYPQTIAVSPPMMNQPYLRPGPPILANPLDGLKALLPIFPGTDQSILPTIKKVLPTGEKPLYVLTFKCPTEVIGITTPPIKAVHWLVTTGMDTINGTDLLPFNMQQVCQ